MKLRIVLPILFIMIIIKTNDGYCQQYSLNLFCPDYFAQNRIVIKKGATVRIYAQVWDNLRDENALGIEIEFYRVDSFFNQQYLGSSTTGRETNFYAELIYDSGGFPDECFHKIIGRVAEPIGEVNLNFAGVGIYAWEFDMHISCPDATSEDIYFFPINMSFPLEAQNVCFWPKGEFKWSQLEGPRASMEGVAEGFFNDIYFGQISTRATPFSIGTYKFIIEFKAYDGSVGIATTPPMQSYDLQITPCPLKIHVGETINLEAVIIPGGIPGKLEWTLERSCAPYRVELPTTTAIEYIPDRPGLYKFKAFFYPDHGSSMGVTSQNIDVVFEPNIEIESIQFDYDGSNAITLMDHETNKKIKTPEWIKGRNEEFNEPAAFVKGHLIGLKVKLKSDRDCDVQIYSSYEQHLNGQLVRSVFYDDIEFIDGKAEALFFTIFPYNPGIYEITLNWGYYKFNRFKEISTTKHKLYITNAEQAEYLAIGIVPDSPFMFKQLAELSCEWMQNADKDGDGKLTDSEIINACFLGCNLLFKKGYRYVFPFIPISGKRGLNAFFDEKKGACGEWATLLHEAIAFHGVKTHVVGLEPDPDSITWGDHPLLNYYAFNYKIIAKAIGWSCENIWYFGDHAVLMDGWGEGNIFDPTFGLKNTDSIGVYEDSLVGWFCRTRGERHPDPKGDDVWPNPEGNNSRIWAIDHFIYN